MSVPTHLPPGFEFEMPGSVAESDEPQHIRDWPGLDRPEPDVAANLEADKFFERAFGRSPPDTLEELFSRQRNFMEMLRDDDKLPEWPISLETKQAQRQLKETIFNTIEELMEASMTLRNKIHRKTDDGLVDRAHFREELGDALAYWMEVCILSGFTAEEMATEFRRKNAEVIQRFERGY
jgi:NTP pyrophosphatase (non-canonical NTP hydrolase)